MREDHEWKRKDGYGKAHEARMETDEKVKLIILEGVSEWMYYFRCQTSKVIRHYDMLKSKRYDREHDVWEDGMVLVEEL